MIRYALVLVLAAAIVGAATTGAQQVATARGEQAVRAEVQTVGAAAESLAEESPTPGPGPRRIVTVDLHGRERLRAEPEQIRFEAVGSATRVTFRVEGGVTQQTTIPVAIRHADAGPVELTTWDRPIRLVLRRVDGADGRPVVTVEPYT